MTTMPLSLSSFPKLSCNFFPNYSPKLPPNSPSPNFLLKSPIQLGLSVTRSQLSGNAFTDDSYSDSTVESLKVPDHWLEPSQALLESEWLRVALNKWLDDEYCPEPTNVDISRVAAESYYQSLLKKETDLGEILLKMAKELESLSYQESFHGPFSSANAAVSLITQKMEQD